MLDPTTVKIGDRVRDLVMSKAGCEQLGTVAAIDRDTRVVRIAWDWITAVDTAHMTTWYLEPLERPTK